MNEDQFSAMLAIIVPPIIEQITKNSNVDDEKAISRFYQSKLYQELSDEKSKLVERRCISANIRTRPKPATTLFLN